ncbi:MAG: DUF2887 domain-containing protein [Desulfobacterales bacterium]|nr:DUF2887 domain-containing protein [Desulfobacterales bacterium]MBF0397408.1 DUF2887 domain-containing protein [Desulfobacterales bacterium]
MKTDALFYELFKFDPSSLIELLQLDIKAKYEFESITIKTTEKRFDGFFKSLNTDAPNIFLEVQGYKDQAIYYRLFREICTYYEQTKDKKKFIGVVVFIDEKYDPDNSPFLENPPNRLIKVSLIECLKGLKNINSILVVLKPLIFEDKDKLHIAVKEWKEKIDSIGFAEDKRKIVIDLLEYAILQKFSGLKLKEVRNMLELTPLEKTVAGQELIQIGKREGKREGKKEGKKEGKIETAKNLLLMKLLSIEEISKVTGLSIEEIKKLKISKLKKL